MRRTAGAGQCDAVLGAAPEVGSRCGQKCGGPAVATHVSGIHIHRAAAEPAPGEHEGHEGVQGGGPPPDVPHARGVVGTRRRRSTALPRWLVHLLWLCRDAVRLQGAGLRDQASIALLSVEAMGSATLPATASPRREPGPGLEHGQVRPWAVAHQPQPGAGDRAPWELLRRPGIAATPSRFSSLTESTEPPAT